MNELCKRKILNPRKAYKYKIKFTCHVNHDAGKDREVWPSCLELGAEDTNGIGVKEKEALLNLARLPNEGALKLSRDNKPDALVSLHS